jgi:DNA-binding NtrC family response regulator
MTKPIRIYQEKDYKGCLNLLWNEKRLILRANERFFGHRRKMAEALEISVKVLYVKIKKHGLEL